MARSKHVDLNDVATDTVSYLAPLSITNGLNLSLIAAKKPVMVPGNLGALGDAAPLWIYGHNHCSANEIIRPARGATHIVSDQLGYPDEHGPFQIDCIVET